MPAPTPADAVRPAGLGRRLGAMVYDGMLMVALWAFTLYLLVMVANDAVYGAAVQSLLFLELYGFFVYFWTQRGQTLGMLAWRLELRTEDRAPLTLAQVTLRFFAALLSFACLGLGYLWIIVDRQKRAWPDLMSSTRVVMVPTKPRR